MNGVFKISLLRGWLPQTMMTLTAVCLIAVVLLKSKKGWLRPLLSQIGIGIASFAAGLLLAWLLSDVFMVFGVSLGWTVMTTIAVGIGVSGALIAALVRSKGLRRVLAVVSLVLTILTCALKVDAIYGEYATLGSVFGVSQYSRLKDDETRHAQQSVKQWQALAAKDRLPQMPSKGEVHSVNIPATTSGFRARTANVYLPPAALSAKPPALPVMIVMSGQPGSPDRFFSAGQLGRMLNDYAAGHDGLAPIAVSPDQNGALAHNSLCSDTPVYGKAETYLTTDVTTWIKQTLPASTDPHQWLIGGFSQGGTCSTQLGAEHPDLYGHVLSVGGEIEPVDGTHRKTLERFFDSTPSKYAKHVPVNIIKSHAPSNQTWFSAAGEHDGQSQRNQKTIAKAAMDAGMQVTTVIVKGTGHDWHTVQAAMSPEITMFCKDSGLGDNTKSIDDYPNLEVVESRTTRKD